MAFAISREVLGDVAFGRRDTSLNLNTLLKYLQFNKWSQNLSLGKSILAGEGSEKCILGVAP